MLGDRAALGVEERQGGVHGFVGFVWLVNSCFPRAREGREVRAKEEKGEGEKSERWWELKGKKKFRPLHSLFLEKKQAEPLLLLLSLPFLLLPRKTTTNKKKNGLR